MKDEKVCRMITSLFIMFTLTCFLFVCFCWRGDLYNYEADVDFIKPWTYFTAHPYRNCAFLHKVHELCIIALK